MRVPYFCGLQRSCQNFLVELRVMSRSGNRPYVYDFTDLVGIQDVDEIFNRSGRMADGVNARLLRESAEV